MGFLYQIYDRFLRIWGCDVAEENIGFNIDTMHLYVLHFV